ncbi:SNF1 protein kinase subunit beta-3 [Nakaseomyces bracarensis]|uniref:SNF1 protein kinase subunit beta-3 n=1 Tax=Nakaseomyces bracarensis TaxID=273131 RepID=A0ABR4NN34_9SACH
MSDNTNNNNNSNRDASMIDVSDVNAGITKANDPLSYSFSQMNVDSANELEPQLTTRHRSRSTLIFDDDDEIPPYSKHEEHYSGTLSDFDGEENSSVTSSIDSGDNGSDANMMFDNTDATTESTMENKSQADSNSSQVQDQGQGIDPQPRDGRASNMVPVDITWQQGGSKVYVTGSFTGWRKMIGLVPMPDQPDILHVKLQLPPGTHRFRFIVDNELRFSDFLPTATDQMGNFVNYLEVAPPDQPEDIAKTRRGSDSGEQAQGDDRKQPMSARSRIALEIEREPDDLGNGYSRFHDTTPLKPNLEYTQDIPAVFTDPNVMEQYYLTLDQQKNNHQNMAWLTPPQLPPHLENVILNSYSSTQGESSNENNSGALPIPNHVILNHLATSSIKHNTLCVASIVRYKRKYVTQILYAPLQ